MARKKKEIEILLCDVCGEETDFVNWYMTANSGDSLYNGGVSGEFYCPYDLCEDCMRHYNGLVFNSIRYTRERYDGSNEEEMKEGLKKMKEMYNTID